MLFELESTTSPDGTKIAYYRVGKGPGLLIVHGAMQSAYSHSELAQHLSSHFTCYLPDRRGRGQSGPLGEDYSPSKEVADLQNLVGETGTSYLFGVGSGALLALNAARGRSSEPSSPSTLAQSTASKMSSLKRIAVFEPPWWPEEELVDTTVWVKRYEQELSRGELAESLATAMLGTKTGPPFLHSRFMPRWAVLSAARFMIHSKDESQDPNTKNLTIARPSHGILTHLPSPVSFRTLAQSLYADISIGQNMFGREKLETLADVKLETLILNGRLSAQYLHRSVYELAKVLPNARRIELPNAEHTVTGNSDDLGDPISVAKELQKFFLGDETLNSQSNRK